MTGLRLTPDRAGNDIYDADLRPGAFATRPFQADVKPATALVTPGAAFRKRTLLAQSGDTATWTMWGRLVAETRGTARAFETAIIMEPHRANGRTIRSTGSRCPKVGWSPS